MNTIEIKLPTVGAEYSQAKIETETYERLKPLALVRRINVQDLASGIIAGYLDSLSRPQDNGEIVTIDQARRIARRGKAFEREVKPVRWPNRPEGYYVKRKEAWFAGPGFTLDQDDAACLQSLDDALDVAQKRDVIVRNQHGKGGAK